MIFGSVRIESFIHKDELPGKQSPKYIRTDTDVKNKIMISYKTWLKEMLNASSKGEKIQSIFKVVGMESKYNAAVMISATTIDDDSSSMYQEIDAQFELSVPDEPGKLAIRLADVPAPFKSDDLSKFDEQFTNFCDLMVSSDECFKDNFEGAMITKEIRLDGTIYYY